MSVNEAKNNPIIGAECRFVTHLPSIPDVRDDIHIVKEALHMKDGTIKPNIRVIKNFKKPFWVTKEHYQNYKQKKEAETLDRVNKYFSTESDIAFNVASKLGSKYNGVKNLRQVRDSPYIYGLDVSSKAYIKKAYSDKYPNLQSQATVAVLDIEATVKEGKVLILTINMGDKLFSAVHKDYLPDTEDVRERIEYVYKHHVPKTKYTENIKRQYMFCDDEMQMVVQAFKKLHEWKPDFVEVWNIGYDVPKIMDVCKRFNVDPKDIFSDPSLPKEFRYFKYREGKTSKLTESGKYKPLGFHEQWHTVDAPASFYFVDGMSVYYLIRQGSKKVPTGYSLDSILDTELGKEFIKLKFKDGVAEKLVKEQWHMYMVEHRPVEYLVYNNYDVIGPNILDAKTQDIRGTMSMLAQYSHFDIFDSGPKRIVEDMHFVYLSEGRVLGSKGSRSNDDKGLGLDDWIVLLPSYRRKSAGGPIINESGSIETLIRTHVADADQVSGYPSDGQAANVSKNTTTKELLDVEGIDKVEFKKQNINLMFGVVNHGEYVTKMLKMPTVLELMASVEEDLAERNKANNTTFEKEKEVAVA